MRISYIACSCLCETCFCCRYDHIKPGGRGGAPPMDHTNRAGSASASVLPSTGPGPPATAARITKKPIVLRDRGRTSRGTLWYHRFCRIYFVFVSLCMCSCFLLYYVEKCFVFFESMSLRPVIRNWCMWEMMQFIKIELTSDHVC